MKKSHKSLSQRILRGSSIIFVFSIITAPLGYFIRILYSQTLSIEMFGLFYAVFAFINFFTLYNDLGFGSSLAYYTPKFIRKSDYADVWNSYKYSQIITILSSLLIAIILFTSADWLSANYFKIAAAKNLIYILIIFFLTNGFITITSSFFVGLQKEIYYSSKELIRLFFTFLFSIIFWFYDSSNIIFYATSWSLAHILTAIIFYYLLYKKNFHLVTPLKWNRELFNKLLKYAIPSILVTSVYSLITSTDIFFLTIFRGLREVGVYNVILPLASIPMVLLIPLSNFFLPLTSDLMEDEKDKVSKIVEALLIYIPFFVFYFAMFIIIFPQASVSFLFGSKWASLVGNTLPILAMGVIFTNLSYYLSIITLGMGFIKERLRISIILAIVNLILSCILIYAFGILGAVLAYLSIYALSTYFYGATIKKAVHFKYPLSFYLKLLIFALILYLLNLRLGIKLEGNTFIPAGFVYTVIMLLFAYFLGLFNKKVVKLLT